MRNFETRHPDLSHRLAPSEALVLGEKLEQLLRLDDLKREVDDWLSRQPAAATALSQRGYAAWRDVPRHPFAAGLVAFERWVSSGAHGFPPEVRPFLEWAYLIENFRPDWEAHAKKFSNEIRSKNMSTIFELLVGHQFRLAGHIVKYIFPQDGRGKSFDLLLGRNLTVEVECKLVRAYEPIIEEVASQIFPRMTRLNQHRVIFIKCTNRAVMRDVGPLCAELREGLHLPPPTSFATEDGRFKVTIENGGSLTCPLPPTQIRYLSHRLDEYGDRIAEIEGMSRLVATPSGFIRGIGLSMDKPLDHDRRLVDEACSASSQLTGTRPGVAAVGLGSPIPRDQANLRNILSQIRQETLRQLKSRSLAAGAESKISGVHLFLPVEGDTETSEPAIAGGLTRAGWSSGIHHAFRNPEARYPLPDGFQLRYTRKLWTGGMKKAAYPSG